VFSFGFSILCLGVVEGKHLTFYNGFCKYSTMNKTPETPVEKLGRGKGRKKWDMEKIETLFMGGAEMSDILKLPEFSQMSRFYLKNCMVKWKWIEKRKRLREQVANVVAPKLEDLMAVETANHYTFMLREIAAERKQIEERHKTGNIKEQAARLDVLAEYEKIATRALGLDENNMHDRKGLSVNAMINLHVTGPTKADKIEIVSAEYVQSAEDVENESELATIVGSGEG
jgi:hypothetical protein